MFRLQAVDFQTREKKTLDCPLFNFHSMIVSIYVGDRFRKLSCSNLPHLPYIRKPGEFADLTILFPATESYLSKAIVLLLLTQLPYVDF